MNTARQTPLGRALRAACFLFLSVAVCISLTACGGGGGKGKSDPDISKLDGFNMSVDAWRSDDGAFGLATFRIRDGWAVNLRVAQELPEPTDESLQEIYPEVPTNADLRLTGISFSQRRLELQCDLTYMDELLGVHEESLIIAFTFTGKVDFRNLGDAFVDYPEGDATVTRIIKDTPGAPALHYTIKEVNGEYAHD